MYPNRDGAGVLRATRDYFAEVGRGASSWGAPDLVPVREALWGVCDPSPSTLLSPPALHRWDSQLSTQGYQGKRQQIRASVAEGAMGQAWGLPNPREGRLSHVFPSCGPHLSIRRGDPSSLFLLMFS